MTTKTVKIGDLFTEEELHEAQAIGSDHARLRDEIVSPALKRINEVTGQQNDADRTWDASCQRSS